MAVDYDYNKNKKTKNGEYIFCPYGEMKRHRTLGITRSFCDLFVWGERKTSSRSSSGKVSHCAHPETNSWHPCQCFKTKKKAHNRKLTVPDCFVLQPREPAYFTYKSGMKWQKSKLGAARSEDEGEISIVRRRKETLGVLRSSALQTVLLWNKPSWFPSLSKTLASEGT